MLNGAPKQPQVVTRCADGEGATQMFALYGNLHDLGPDCNRCEEESARLFKPRLKFINTVDLLAFCTNLQEPSA